MGYYDAMDLSHVGGIFEEITREKDVVQYFAKQVAAEVVKMQSPAKDKISRVQLFKDFGSVWCKKQIRLGLLVGRRGGSGGETSPIYFSRADVLALYEAEKRTYGKARESLKNTK